MTDLSVRPGGSSIFWQQETMAQLQAAAARDGMTVVEWVAMRNINHELVSNLRFRRNQREIGDAEWEQIKATYRHVRLTPHIERK